MPLDPLPSNNVPVLFVHYSVNGKAHTLQMRSSGDLEFENLRDKATNFLNALMPVADPSFVVTGTDYREAGADVALPVTTLSIDTATGDPIDDTRNPLEHRFVGRGTITGRRVTLSVYGLDLVLQPTYRVVAGMSGAVDDALEVLNLSPFSAATTVAGDRANWYPYVNQNFNSHWETEARV